jgi:hypothetical protein
MEINPEEYSDRVDVDFDTALLEYGFARNPKTDHVLISRPRLDTPSDSEEYSDYNFDWTEISREDVLEALEDMEPGFWSFIGQDNYNPQEVTNDFLANWISSIDSYDGRFFETFGHYGFLEVDIKEG